MTKEDRISFLTDDNTEVEFFILEQTTLNAVNYLLVTQDPAGEEDTIVYIMKETADLEDGLVSYEFVEEDEELYSVGKVFEQLMEDTDIEVE